MRKLNDRTKAENLRVLSLPEVKRALETEVDRVSYVLNIRLDIAASSRRGARQQRPELTHLVNWILLSFLDLTEDVRDEAIRRGRKLLEEIQARDVPGPVRVGGSGPIPAPGRRRARDVGMPGYSREHRTACADLAVGETDH